MKAFRGDWAFIGGAAALTIPAIVFRLAPVHAPVHVETIFFGLGILGAAFLLSWAAEVAELDISQALAIAFLAFVAVLPEYAVDLVFAWTAGKDDAYRHYAVANMTGGNRLLIGLGWSVVVLLWLRRSHTRKLVIEPHHRTEIGFLLVATLWAFTIPLRRQLGFLDLAVLGSLFVAYLWRAAKQESEPPELVGPPQAIAALGVRGRRIATVAMFLFSGAVILGSAEPFAHGLVDTGTRFGINKFLLVQWVAPLASEAPEMIVAILFVLRSRPTAGLGTLISSKVNQWTLLIATLPLVYAISRGGNHPLVLDERQVEEVLLTAAQSVFAIAVLANLSITKWEAIGLLTLFLAQFGFENTAVRYGFSFAYLALFVAIVLFDDAARRGLVAALKQTARPPWKQLDRN